jgi:hypothetical protein
LQESLLGLLESPENSLLGIVGEAVLLDNEVVQLVSEVLCTGVAAMAIVDSEETTFGPDLLLAVGRFVDVEDDADPVFIVIPDQTLVGDGCVPSHDSISLDGALCGFFIRYYNSGAWLQGQFVFLQLVFGTGLLDHLVDVQSGQLPDLLVGSRHWVYFHLMDHLVFIFSEQRPHVFIFYPDELRQDFDWRLGSCCFASIQKDMAG